MSLVGTYNPKTESFEKLQLQIDKQTGMINNNLSPYNPSAKELAVLEMVTTHFQMSYVNMYKPRVEFNDLSVISRLNVDEMAFNTYQPNNGDPAVGDQINGWRSRAVRPIVRNKCISIAAHATARLIFPKIFAYDFSSDEQKDAAKVMEDLNEWVAEQTNYPETSLRSIITALYSPASIIYKEYAEVYRNVKRERKSDGSYEIETILDKDLSGFKDTVVSADELYIENFYENDIQKQGWLIWRRVLSYSLLEAKYKSKYENFKYVTPGVQLVYNDANQSFYQVYDTNMRPTMGEEIIYWNKNMDIKIIIVNGVMLTEYDNPNPRNDKQYPFVKFGYEIINNRCFYYKSLAFKIGPDADIVNTLYPMIIDGTYLNLMPPMIVTGGEIINQQVIVPGAISTFSSPDADMRAIKTSENLQAGMNTLFRVDESINQSSEIPVSPERGGKQTAYEISKREQERNVVLGLFVQMISSFVKAYGKLQINDILQFLTIAEVSSIEGNTELLYKDFLIPNKQSDGKIITRKIKFDKSLPSEPITEEEMLKESYKTLKSQGDKDKNIELYRVNPELFRNLNFSIYISPDVMNPMSEELERAFNLEEYDRAINNPLADQEAVTRDLLFGSYRKTKGSVDKFIKKQEVANSNSMEMFGGNNMGSNPAQQEMTPPLKNQQPNLNKLIPMGVK